MKLWSQAFANGGPISVRHTGFGEDLSPELIIEDIPAGTQSLAIVPDDPDVPLRRAFPHRVIWGSAD